MRARCSPRDAEALEVGCRVALAEEQHLTIDDPSVVPVADDVLALVYRATGRRGDTEFSSVMTRRYVRSPDGRHLVLRQQTAQVTG